VGVDPAEALDEGHLEAVDFEAVFGVGGLEAVLLVFECLLGEVAEDDWMMAVTSPPVTAALTRLVVKRARMSFILPPAADLSPSAICSIPKRKRARPPQSCISMIPQAGPEDGAEPASGEAAKTGRIKKPARNRKAGTTRG
jgi:hypothetical protein